MAIIDRSFDKNITHFKTYNYYKLRYHLFL